MLLDYDSILIKNGRPNSHKAYNIISKLIFILFFNIMHIEFRKIYDIENQTKYKANFKFFIFKNAISEYILC